MAEPGRQLPLLDAAAPPLPLLDARDRGTRFLGVAVRTALNSPETTGMGFWSLNPYVGCEFGCSYCYARDTHRYAIERAQQRGALDDPALDAMPAWQAFERRILVKRELAAALARQLGRTRLAGAQLSIGSATDPYQPAERQFRITRAALEVLAQHRDLVIGIITKSPLVARDIDLLRRIGERHALSVHLSLITVDAEVARRLEPRSPAPHARLRALARLRHAGIEAGIMMAPVVPLLTDAEPALRALFAAARVADARWVHGHPLRLGAAARRRFLPHLLQQFPELEPRYRQHFGAQTHVRADYRAALRRRLHRLQEEFGFRRQPAAPAVVARASAGPPQLTLLAPLPPS